MNKKIAFILFGHTAATFPLIKRLCNLGYSVDAYFICKANIHFIEGFSEVDISLNKRIQLLQKEETSSVYTYVSSDRFRFFGVKFSEDYVNYKFINYLLRPYLNLQYKLFCKQLNQESYDLVNIVTRVNVFANVELLKSLKSKVVLSLHEVHDHFKAINFNNRNPNIPKVYRVAEKKQCNIVVFSQNSKLELLKLGVDSKIVSVINFGLFETYSTIFPEAPCKLPDNYGLFIGMIKPYKGLNILYDAVVKNNKKIGGQKYVIAGSGDDPILQDVKNLKDFLVLNRYLNSSELVYLIKYCRYLVCPYITMSQSGIPQMAFVFNKPIIASDLDGFKEVIGNEENGLLFISNDSSSLANTLEKINDERVYANLVNGTKFFSNKHNEFNWDEITNTFVSSFL